MIFSHQPLSDKETKKLDDTMQRFRDWLEHLYGGKELPAEHVDDEELDFAPDLRLDPKKSEKDKRRNTWAVLDPPDPWLQPQSPGMKPVIFKPRV